MVRDQVELIFLVVQTKKNHDRITCQNGISSDLKIGNNKIDTSQKGEKLETLK